MAAARPSRPSLVRVRDAPPDDVVEQAIAAEASVRARHPMDDVPPFAEHPVFLGVVRLVLASGRSARLCLQHLMADPRRARELFRWNAMDDEEMAAGLMAAATLRRHDLPALRDLKDSGAWSLRIALGGAGLFFLLLLGSIITKTTDLFEAIRSLSLQQAAPAIAIHVAAAAIIVATWSSKTQRRIVAIGRVDRQYADAYSMFRLMRGVLDGVPRRAWPRAMDQMGCTSMLFLVMCVLIVALAALMVHAIMVAIDEVVAGTVTTLWVFGLSIYVGSVSSAWHHYHVARSQASARRRLEELVRLVRAGEEMEIDRA